MQIALLLISVFLFIVGQMNYDCVVLFVSLGLLFSANLLYGIERMSERFVFFFFNSAGVFFLYGRTLIKILEQDNWQGDYSNQTHFCAISIIYASALSLLAGAVFYGQLRNKKSETPPKITEKRIYESDQFIKNLQIVSFIMYIFLTLFMLAVEFEKPIKLNGMAYTEYYYAYESSLPGIVLTLSALAKFVLCLFLATMPQKSLAFIALGIYVVSTIPVFIVGQRNQFISAALFVVCYYLIRDYFNKHKFNKSKKWFGKFEKTSIAIALPFLFAFLSIYESMRLDIEVQKKSIVSSIKDLFYSQGVTYDVICKCIKNLDKLPTTNFNYTFGSLFNYLKENAIGAFFGFESYKPQTVESALYGNKLGDTISYIDLGDRYLNGAGLGSSFIIENYIDFGYIGVLLFSFFLGMFLIWMVKNFNKNIFVSYIVLVSLLQLFMLPRSTASGGMVLIIYIPAIFFIGILFFASYLCQKEYYK
ncbi:MAG: O-antigen polysaccharide polymerase Wzy family protein [Candidatus Fimenecus sp.]